MKRVVVTGLGVISPVGNEIETFWENIKNGVCGVDYITRFDTADFKVKVAAEVKNFPRDQYFAPNEARKTDLYAQYALAAAAQAMEDSGIAGTVASSRLGVYVGSGIGGMNTFITECNKLEKSGPRRISPFFVPMMIANIAAGMIAIKYKAQGPCLPIVTACATGTHAVGEAFQCIQAGRADAVIAGGAEATITPLAVAGFTNCMALSTRNDPQHASTPFDLHRDGFVMGEGAGILVLEEYEHAKARNAKIYGELVGYGNTCDAYHITAPDPEGAMGAEAIRLAMAEAGILDGDHDLERVYVNAHGTSTPLNDKCETMALKKVLGDGAYRIRISATKSMTGHMLGAAGAVEAVISLLALRDGIVPPTIGYETPDPECDLNCTPNQAVSADLTYAVSDSLGFGGHNACIAFRKI